MNSKPKISIFLSAILLIICANLALVVPASTVLAPSAKTIESADNARFVMPVGLAIGVVLPVGGILVQKTEKGSSAAECGLKANDIITEVNHIKTENIEDFIAEIQRAESSALLLVKRGNRTIEIEARPKKDDFRNEYKMGMWAKDCYTGIGTLTWVDGTHFSAVGHAISENGMAVKYSGEGGFITPCTIFAVDKGTPNNPGELKGTFSQLSKEKIGIITANSEEGVIGDIASQFDGVSVETSDEITVGDASILANVNSSSVPETYKIKIEKTPQWSSNTFVIQIVDERLIAETGGIVQGMSGCPILQNGKLVGAVTHVFFGDNTRGYAKRIK